MADDSVIAALSAAANWHKSSFSGGENGGCVEVGFAGAHVGIRDTKLGPASPIIVTTRCTWREFLRGVGNGEFELV